MLINEGRGISVLGRCIEEIICWDFTGICAFVACDKGRDKRVFQRISLTQIALRIHLTVLDS
jgi:hypothetical protein